MKRLVKIYYQINDGLDQVLIMEEAGLLDIVAAYMAETTIKGSVTVSKITTPRETGKAPAKDKSK